MAGGTVEVRGTHIRPAVGKLTVLSAEGVRIVGLMEKLNLRGLKARAKLKLGGRMGNRRLAAEGRTEEAEAKLLRTQEEILDTVAEMRKEYGVRRRG